MHRDRPDVLSNPIRVCSDQALKLGEHIYDSMDDLRNVVGDGKVSILAKNSTFKSYVEKKLRIHFHFRLWSFGGIRDFGDCCAFIESAINDSEFFVPLGLKISPVGMSLGHSEELVLISGVQFLKEPEKVLLRFKSRVWLNVANGSECVWMHSGDEMSATNHSVKSRSALVDGKYSASVGETTARQSPSNVVECGTRIVNAVADDKRQSGLRYRFTDLQLEQIFELFVVIFFDDGVGLRIKKSSDFLIKSTIMFFSPIDFVPTFE